MKTNIIGFEYNPDTGMTCCYLEKDGIVTMGTAVCHIDDMEFASERTGGFIAESRANINMLRELRNRTKFSLKPLKHLYSNMRTSKHFNPHSYEAKMIRSQIKALEREIEAYNADIKMEQQYLSDYIKNKELMYQKYRGQK